MTILYCRRQLGRRFNLKISITLTYPAPFYFLIDMNSPMVKRAHLNARKNPTFLILADNYIRVCAGKDMESMRYQLLTFALLLGLAANGALAAGPTTNEDKPVEIPLIRSRNTLYAPAEINGSRIGYLIVDTGSSITTLYKGAADQLKLLPVGRKKIEPIAGTREETVEEATTFSVGPLTVHNQVILVQDRDSFKFPSGAVIAGAIGMDVLGRQPFTINFRTATLTLHPSGTFNPSEYGVESPLQAVGETPRIYGSVEEHYGWFEIDTGYARNVLLSEEFILQNADLVETRPQIRWNASWPSPTDRYDVRWQSVKYLAHTASNVAGEFQAVQGLTHVAGLLGTRLFDDLELTIDMNSRRVWAHWLDPEPLADLLNRLPKLQSQDISGMTRLLWAAYLNRSDAVGSLLASGSDPNVHDARGLSPLIDAVSHNDVKSVAALLTHGANVNASSPPSGFTALMTAAWCGSTDATKLLIDAGADVNLMGQFDRTPLFLAAESGHEEIVELLLSKGAQVDGPLSTGETPLFAASANGNAKCAKVMLDHKANPNAAETHGSCLTVAAKAGQIDCVQLLIENGVDLNRLAPNGENALAAAASLGSVRGTACVEALLKAGANPKQKCSDGKTALDRALQSGSVKSIQLLRPYFTE